MQNSNQRNGNNRIIRVYTGLFVIMFFLCVGIYYLLAHKALFRIWDGYDQHYQSFVYIGNWVRDWVTGIVKNHSFALPLWDMSIGYGSDVITSLGAYLGDPFNWISIVTPSLYSEYVYDLVIVAKIYLSGLSFIILARSRNLETLPMLAGAMTYIFSGTMLVAYYQFFFINPFYIFPLIILGIDLIFKGKTPVLYIVMLGFAFLNYFYFAYMICILIVGYCVLKLIFDKEFPKTAGSVGVLVGRFFVYSILSAGASSVLLIPIVSQLLGAGRLSVERYVPMLYDKGYYLSFVSGFSTDYDMLGRDCKIGFGIIAVVCVLALFLVRGKYTQVKTEFIITTIGMLLPVVGCVMNGMNYVANRWVFAYCLLVSYIVAVVVPELIVLEKNRKVMLTLLSVFYVVVVWLIRKNNIESLLQLVILAVFLLGFMAAKKKEIFERLSLIVVCGALILMNYETTGRNQIASLRNNYVDAGSAYRDAMNRGGLPLLSQVQAVKEERYDRSQLNYIRNSSWLYGISGMDFYISLYNDLIDQFHNDLQLLTSPHSYGYEGLNQRSELEALCGVNHYLSDREYGKFPYGYDIEESSAQLYGTEVVSNTTQHQFSLFYWFDKVVSGEEYSLLSAEERQQVLLQAIVSDSESVNTAIDELEISDDRIDVKVTPLSGIEISEGMIKVTEPDGKIQLTIPETENAEVYVSLENIDCQDAAGYSYVVSAQAFRGDQLIEGMSTSFEGMNYKHHMYGNKHDWLLNLGYSDDPVDRIELTFNRTGTYSFDGIGVQARKASKIDRNIEQLDSAGIEASIGINTISVTTDSEADHYLLTTIPYSEGWKASIDGKEIAISVADTAFMAVAVEAGHHVIQFTYCTPWLFPGILFSVVSIILLVIIVRRESVTRKKGEAQS